MNISEELKKIPSLPGVYIMRDDNCIIYVGKAVNLHNRVRSYFQKSQNNPKTLQLAKNTTNFEYVVTDNESEALILENNLIKLHCPKYNIRLKDDKAYPYIKITRERLPRILYSSRRGKDKAKYYGPFVSKMHVRELLELIHRLWPLRRCSKVFPRDFEKTRPCLNHHIGQCKAPCNHLLNEKIYEGYLAEAEQFIQGKDTTVLSRLMQEMSSAAESMEYERAAEIRDTINALRLITEKQKAESGNEDRDIIALARENDEALMQIFFVRDGKLSGREHYMMAAAVDEMDSEILSAFIKQFYSEAAFIPKELVIVSPLAEQDLISSWLSSLTGRQVTITVPKTGEKRKLADLAQTNAELTIRQFGAHIKREAERNKNALHELSTTLDIPMPIRIEAYDISNIQGYESVGSMVVFENGKAKNSDYRKFKLRAVVGSDDYAGMEEVLTRRFIRYNSPQAEESFSKLPDVIFADGGKGQISAVEKALAAQNIVIPVCGMVKDDRHRTRGLLYKGEEVNLPRHSEGFKLVTRIQDEVHRFALEYHKKLRSDSQVRSVLDDIKGIGATRRRELLRHFKSIEAIRNADVTALAAAPSMNSKSAQEVYNFFRKGD